MANMITAQKGDKTRRFGVLQWNRLLKARQTDGWVEVKGGAQPPRQSGAASPNKAFSPPEVTNFPLKTRQETEDAIRAQVESEVEARIRKEYEDKHQAQIAAASKQEAVTGTGSGPQGETPAQPAQNKATGTEAPQRETPKQEAPETPAADQHDEDMPGSKTTGAASNPNAAKNKTGQSNQAGSGKGSGK